MSIKNLVRKKLTTYWDHRYQKRLQSYVMSYPQWIRTLEMDESHAESMEGENDFVMISFHNGSWGKNAKQMLAQFFKDHPQALLVYGDEDVQVRNGSYDQPWLKPCWSPDTFLYRDYLGEAVCVRKELYEKLTDTERMDQKMCHRRLVELADGFKKGCRSIEHMNGIIFHRRSSWDDDHINEKKGSIEINESKETKENIQQDNKLNSPLVSIIIPSKDNVTILQQCIRTVRETVLQIPYEVIIVDNGSCQHAKIQMIEYTEKINHDLTKNSPLRSISYFYEPMEFNFSKLCNLGAKNSTGRLLLFLNDDIEAVQSDWLEQMAEKALKPWTGAVGMKLWYPDSDRIQHAGITNISIGPVHKLQFLKDNKRYYDGRNEGIRNVLAVTGACMMMRKEVFQETGGFSEEMRVAFNDVDLCFTLHEMGYYNVVINTSHLLHHESLSRGSDDSEEKMKRLIKERDILYKHHPLLENTDPFYHKWLNQNGLDTRIVPTYLEGCLKHDQADFQTADVKGSIKKNDCLLLRIEYADTKRIQGYAVVLGSDNACYNKKLIFKSKTFPEQIYLLDVKEQYRSDIAENMPDQVNIALCGFQTEFASLLPKGEYRVGALAKDRISGKVLMNFSNRSICV